MVHPGGFHEPLFAFKVLSDLRRITPAIRDRLDHRFQRQAGLRRNRIGGSSVPRR